MIRWIIQSENNCQLYKYGNAIDPIDVFSKMQGTSVEKIALKPNQVSPILCLQELTVR